MGSLGRHGCFAIALACLAALVFAGVAGAQTLTLGPVLKENSAIPIPCGTEGEGCGLAMVGLTEGTVASPVAGLVTAWRISEPASVAGYELIVLRPNADGTYTATDSSGPVTPNEEDVATFPTRLSIAVGDIIGIVVPFEGQLGALNGDGTYAFFEKPLRTGATGTATPEEMPFLLGFNATVEYTTIAPVVPPPIVVPPAAPTEAHCKAPNLVGKKLKAAKKALSGAGCKTGLVAVKTGVKAASAKVTKQAPKAGALLPKGTPVSLKLG